MIDREILAQVRRIQVRTNRMVTDVMSGGYSSVFRGSGIEFDEVREFVEGDDIRAVDWNVTARTGRPHIKKYMEERELTVLFLLDVSASTGFGTVPREAPVAASSIVAAGSGTQAASRPASSARSASAPTRGRGKRVRTVRDTAAEFCACLALAAARNNDKIGMITFTDRVERYIPAKKGSQHVLRLIREALAAEGRGTGTDLAAAIEYATRVQRRRAVVFVISDFLGSPDFDKSLRLLGRRHDVIAVRLLDPRSRELPNERGLGLLHVRDPETGLACWIDAGSARVRSAFTAQVAKRDADLRRTLRRARVDLLDIAPEHSLIEPILGFFRMRELRGSHG